MELIVRARSLKSRLMMTLVLAVLLPICAFTVSMYYKIEDVEKQALDDQHEKALIIARILEELFYKSQESLESAAVVYSSIAADFDEQVRADRSAGILGMAAARFSEVVALDKTGALASWSPVINKQRAEEIASEFRTSWTFRQTLKSARSTMGRAERESDGDFHLYIGSPVIERGTVSRVSGVIASRINLSELMSAMASRYLPLGASMKLVDKNGAALASFGPPAAQEAVEASAPLSFPEGRIILSSPAADLAAKSYQVLILAVVLIGITLLTSIVFVDLHFKNLSAFFERMHEYIDSLSSGRPKSIKDDLRGEDAEAEEILSKFRAMASSLEKSHMEIVRINELLEDRVAERTRELKRKNALLSAINSLIQPIRKSGLEDAPETAVSKMNELLEDCQIKLSRSTSDGGSRSIDLPGSTRLEVAPADGISRESEEMIAQFASFLVLSLRNETLFKRTSEQHAAISSLLSSISEGFALVFAGRYLFSNENFRLTLSRREIGEFVEAVLSSDWDPGESGEFEVQSFDEVKKKKLFFVVRVFPVDLSALEEAGRLGTAVVIREATREREIAQLKDDVIALASHELNNPLSSIHLGLETLAKKSDRIPEQIKKDMLSALFAQSERLQNLIRDWLDLSLINNGSLSCRPTRQNIVELVESTTAEWSAEKGTPVEASSSSGRIFVDVDPVRLRQVLVNLFENARRYNDHPVPSIAVGIKEEDTRVAIDVSDDGFGISPAEADEIFEHFFRAPRAQSKCPKGSGLGLSICRAIIAEHSGSLELVESTPQGSTFRITLKKAEEHEQR